MTKISNADSSELRAVLENQGARREASARAQALEARITKLASTIAAARAARPTDALASANKQLEDLLAAKELGHVNENAATKREEQLRAYIGELEAKAGVTDADIQRGEQTIAGLRRLLDAENTLRVDLAAARRNLLCEFYSAEASRACERYIRAGEEAQEAFLELVGLDALLTEPGGASALCAFNTRHELRLPAFRMSHFEGRVRGEYREWINSGSPYCADAMKNAPRNVCDALRARGVEFE